jgi:hypothetical protein
MLTCLALTTRHASQRVAVPADRDPPVDGFLEAL